MRVSSKSRTRVFGRWNGVLRGYKDGGVEGNDVVGEGVLAGERENEGD